jgi:NAD(P)-dependent dehydrogenase (short-subunit alcohol dehydrogenase family)
MRLLDGKIALVTGGGAGIGRGIVDAFVEHGAAAIAVAEVDPVRAEDVRSSLAKAGVEALVETCDVLDPEQMGRFLGKLEQSFGGLDVLVNNVGGSTFVGPFMGSTEAQWDALYCRNLRHVFFVTHRAVPLIRKRGRGGSVITVTTIEAWRAAPNHCVYSAFKTGVNGFTRSLAVELGPENIRVNTIAPETTTTPRINPLAKVPPHYRDYIPRWIPLNRLGNVSDAGGCAVFLASDLSAWVSGAAINLDGGALAAGGWYRTPTEAWTNMPIVTDLGPSMP